MLILAIVQKKKKSNLYSLYTCCDFNVCVLFFNKFFLEIQTLFKVLCEEK